MHGLVDPFNPLLPTSELTLIYFISYLAQTVAHKTVKLYLVAVQDLHRKLNYPLQTSLMHWLQKALTGIKRLSSTDRFPITIPVLAKIYSHLQPHRSDHLDHVMLWAAFTLAFFGFLRSREFTCNGPFNPAVYLTAQDQTFVPDSQSPTHMPVKIKNPKRTPFAKATPS